MHEGRRVPTVLRHGQSQRHLAQEVAISLSLPAEPSDGDLERWAHNIAVLESAHGRSGTERVRRAVLANPGLLCADLQIWYDFLVAGFGLPPDSFAKLAADCPALLTQGDVFTAGAAMLFFKSMGWRNKDIAQRIIGYYPQLLMLERPRHIDPVVAFLERLDCTGRDLRLLVWEYPRIFDKDYRRHVRKFQVLGMYGLSLSGGSAAGAAAARRLLEEQGEAALAAETAAGGRPAALGYRSRSPAAPEWL